MLKAQTINSREWSDGCTYISVYQSHGNTGHDTIIYPRISAYMEFFSKNIGLYGIFCVCVCGLNSRKSVNMCM